MIIKNKFIFLTVSAILVVASIALLVMLGLEQGVDFVGGTQWEISTILDQRILQEILPKEFAIANSGDRNFIIRSPELSETDHQKYFKLIKEKDSALIELSFETIGSSIGQELKQKAIWAFLLVIVGISLYISFAFRKVSRPVSSWKYGVITLVTLFHDAIIPTGLMAYLGWLSGMEIGVNFIVALLVVMGFSVHDTIVVFDRIRENLRLENLPADKANFNFAELVNKSIVQTFARSINTSLTLILVLLAMYFLGADSLRNFILIILIGVIVGTYSSIFVASPLLVLAKKK